jgi:hypothetical protein
MKMVRSLLLGSAAGLVAVAGAQAADLPVKAKPVQYVKICSLYGVGFYYIPGTDMCLKIGGWVRAEYAYGDNGNMTWGPFNANANNRTTSNSTFRARGYITADARNQTEYGTVRGYIAVGLSTSDVGLNTAANQFSANRAFIQWAGFTLGLAQSFYDFYSVPATSYWGNFPASDTGDPGWFTMGYTAQFGNGFSATIAAEERRITQIINEQGLSSGVVSTTSGSVIGAFPSAAAVGTTPLTGGAGFAPGAGTYGGFQMPDIVANLRVDQAWGSAQIMGALHQVNAAYYTNGAAPFLSNAAGHPSDKLGWAAGAGVKFNASMIGVGDFFQAQVTYTEGALKYIFQTPNSNWSKVDGAGIGWGTVADAVYAGTLGVGAANTATDLQLTTAWNVNAAYEHFWSPRWKTSVYGGYAAVSYNNTANTLLCGNLAGGNSSGSGLTLVATPGCDNNWNTYWVGTRTQWNVTKDFYMGVDVLYQKLDSASTFNGLSTAALSSTAISSTVGNVDNWAFRFRAHRDFYP